MPTVTTPSRRAGYFLAAAGGVIQAISTTYGPVRDAFVQIGGVRLPHLRGDSTDVLGPGSLDARLVGFRAAVLQRSLHVAGGIGRPWPGRTSGWLLDVLA